MRVEVNGVWLFFDVEGVKLVPDGAVMREQPTLILLHGGPGSGDHSGFKPHMSALTDICQVVYLDQRANGRSDSGDQADMTLAQWGDDVKAFCEALEITRPIVLGISFGGMALMSYATRHPEHPGKLIMVNTSARRNLDRRERAFRRLGGAEAGAIARKQYGGDRSAETSERFREICLPLFSRNGVDPLAAQRTRRRSSALAHLNRPGGEALTYDFLPALASIPCPTLVISGEDDPVAPIEDLEDIAAALPPHLVQFERVPNGRHFLFADDAERVLPIIREFILS